jgi:hypothetical protein
VPSTKRDGWSPESSPHCCLGSADSYTDEGRGNVPMPPEPTLGVPPSGTMLSTCSRCSITSGASRGSREETATRRATSLLGDQANHRLALTEGGRTPWW